MKPFEIWQVVETIDEQGNLKTVDWFMEFKEAREREATTGGYGAKTIRRHAVTLENGDIRVLEQGAPIRLRETAKESIRHSAMLKIHNTLSREEIDALGLK